ncbi:MAG: anthranilate phosphoribosyltransferase [Nitrososphaerales archaeon]
MIQECITKLLESRNLQYEEMVHCMHEIMRGNANDKSIASFLLSLKTKGETVDELKAMLDVMNEFAVKIKPSVSGRLVDTCGTGGDKIKTFNISTVSAFVASAAGVNIAKHGNRSVSGPCGSADVLEYFGYDLDTEPSKVKECIEQLGIGFMFAPKFHPAMKNVANARKELGVRTAFNLLGPLSNPADVDAQVVGVYDLSLIDKIAQLLKNIGRKEAMVFHADDGLDELSNTCINHISWIRDSSIDKVDLDPKTLRISIAERADLSVASKAESALQMFKILNGSADEKKLGVVLLNASAALIVGDKADSFEEGIELARKAIESGNAFKKFGSLIRKCGNVSKLLELEKKWQNS